MILPVPTSLARQRSFNYASNDRAELDRAIALAPICAAVAVVVLWILAACLVLLHGVGLMLRSVIRLFSTGKHWVCSIVPHDFSIMRDTSDKKICPEGEDVRPQ